MTSGDRLLKARHALRTTSMATRSTWVRLASPGSLHTALVTSCGRVGGRVGVVTHGSAAW
jgi:hypothetical protein